MKSIRIGDLGKIVGGGTPSTTNEKYWDGNIPWISPKDLTGCKMRYISCGERNITEEGYNNSSARMLPKGSVLMSSRAPIGYLAIANNDVCTNQGFKSIIPNKDVVNSLYLYYLLQYNIDGIKSIGVGTTFSEVSGGALFDFIVNIHPINEQKKIASILDSIDSKIEVNNEINDYLLKLLETKYLKIKNDFDCDNRLSDICIISKNKILSKELSCNNFYSTENMLPDKKGVQPAATLPSDGKATECEVGNVLISNIRPYFKKIHYCFEPSGCSADVLCFSALDKINSPYLFSILYSDEFFDHVVLGSKGTKMPRGDKEQIMEYKISIPDDETLCEFNKIGKNILDAISANNNINRLLSQQRDIILPKLLSGEIDVSNIEVVN